MIGRFAQSVRAAILEPRCAGAFFEAWIGKRCVAPRGSEGPCDHGALNEFRRLIGWASSPVIRARGYPGDAAIDEQVIALFNAAGPTTREALAEALTRMIEASAAPAFPHALRLAGKIPVPPARTLLLDYITGARNHHRMRFDPRPAALRALGQLQQRELRTIFTTLIERYAERALWDAPARAILHQAGWSLCRIDPHAFADELPWSLQNDPLFLADVITDPRMEPEVRRWLAGLPAERSAMLEAGLGDALGSGS